MGKKLLALLISFSTICTFAQTRPGSLKGQVLEKESGQGAIGASIIVLDDAGGQITGGVTDFKGNFNLNPVPVGTWTVEVSSMGFKTIRKTGVLISPNNPTFLNFKLEAASEMLGEVVIEAYKPPLIDRTKSSAVVTAEDIQNMAVRDVTAVASQAAGVTTDANGNTRVRGARDEGTVYFIDGVKVRGNVNVPQAAIAQTEVITGGLPAQYGDAIGGVINTTTRGPSGEFFGSFEYLTSVPFDDYDYNLLAATVGGPILKKGNKTIIGFLAAAEYRFQVEPSPQPVPYIKLDENLLNEIQENPLVVDPSGNSVNSRSLFVTEQDLTDINARPNNNDNQLRFNTTLQFRTSKSTSFNLGGRLVYENDMRSNYLNHVFNYENNLRNYGLDWAVFARFQQQFTTDEEEAENSLIKNAFYSIQVDYTRNTNRIFDDRFEDNYFAYGNVGKFDIDRVPAYVFGVDEQTGQSGYRFVGAGQLVTGFTEGGYNEVLENYPRQYFELAQDNPGLQTFTLEQILGAGVPINGRNPSNVYGLWGNAGSSQSVGAFNNSLTANFFRNQNSQFRVTASTSFDIKDHSLIVGFEYEQRSDRAWGINTNMLWTQMRALQNSAVTELDLDNPQFVFDDNGVYQDTINYNFLYSEDSRSRFAASLRESLGLSPTGTEQLNIDGLDPNSFSLEMFDAAELYNVGGTPIVKYYGYDKNGNILDAQPSIDDFFTQTDARGDRTFAVGAFQPIYIAGYVQDQFTYKDLTFNAGIRVDRFDLNQSVLRDPFVLFPSYTVGDPATASLLEDGQTIPASIGQDFTVYVDNYDYSDGGSTDGTNIVGYRDGNQWYSADGEPLADPTLIANRGGGQAKPYLIDPDNTELSSSSFKDYEPQVIVMPRVSFTFPIKEGAIFIAHFDKLAQRPTSGIARLDPFQYYDLSLNLDGGTLNNPDLRPQITTEYEIGFKQALTELSALKISAFYRELRDLTQVQLFSQAYPITYTAYGNQDYGTIQGFTLEYELRRTNNVSLNANYTLQFANGTGSGPTSGANLANSGQPNLRYILPLSYDNRHQFLVRFDYRFADGRNYTGPAKGRKIFENFGVNLTANAVSGEPYTQRTLPFSVTTSASSSPIGGQINGARLPWQLRFDMRVNKVFKFKNKNSLDVYFQIFNLLNTINTVAVYAFTGSPDDDGFLTSQLAETTIREQVSTQAFIDLYNRRVNSPFNFSRPRTIRLGVSYNF
jgi:outer membrane receptor protein involved in Fe transport